MAKTVFITGCSDGGIGSALAKRFAERGFNVIASARSMSKMTALETLSNVTLLELDVCSTKSVAAALQAVSVHTGGKLDYLVNNAGVGYRSAALEVDEQMAKALFDVNFWSAVNMCRTFAPLVIEGKGTIVNVSSLSGIGVPILWGCKSLARNPPPAPQP
jgi:NAD(P)-dependent dehydrogenase (short-subunit alcohol dehydrogenase family)